MESETEITSVNASGGEVFTIGHSNHPIETFLELLER